MENVKGLETEVGVLRGRSAIFLDAIVFRSERTVTLVGSFNLEDGERPFEMTFRGIVHFSATELDFDDREQVESLGVVEGSEKLWSFRARDHSRKTNDQHVHYYVRTYDTVFEIVSDAFELTVGT